METSPFFNDGHTRKGETVSSICLPLLAKVFAHVLGISAAAAAAAAPPPEAGARRPAFNWPPHYPGAEGGFACVGRVASASLRVSLSVHVSTSIMSMLGASIEPPLAVLTHARTHSSQSDHRTNGFQSPRLLRRRRECKSRRARPDANVVGPITAQAVWTTHTASNNMAEAVSR